MGDETGCERHGADGRGGCSVWEAASMPLNPRPTGNPLEAVTPAQQERAAQQAKENASYERDRSEWAVRSCEPQLRILAPCSWLRALIAAQDMLVPG